MLRWAFIVTWTALLGAVGLALGWTIHGATLRAALPALAGLTGGFGIGCSGLHVLDLRRSRRSSAD
jgi:hypothetical protein